MPNETASAAKQSLSADSWAEAALEAIAAGGLDAVAVEPLARALGVTKGSFYWHFDSRDALVHAALDLWERRETTEVISGLEDEPDPQERIFKVFRRANSSYKAGRLYLALAAATGDALIGDVVRRVSARRLSYLNDCYQALGMDARDAQLWSTFAYATFIGNQQVHRDAPESFPEGVRFSEYFKLMIRTLIPRQKVEEKESHPAVVSLRPSKGALDKTGSD
jgi:AcrR family transcriptional regulator